MKRTEANAQKQVKFKLDTFYIVSKKDYNQNMGSAQEGSSPSVLLTLIKYNRKMNNIEKDELKTEKEKVTAFINSLRTNLPKPKNIENRRVLYELEHFITRVENLKIVKQQVSAVHQPLRLQRTRKSGFNNALNRIKKIRTQANRQLSVVLCRRVVSHYALNEGLTGKTAFYFLFNRLVFSRKLKIKAS